MTTMVPTLPLGRRAFGSLLLATAGAVIVRPGYGLGATDDPPAPLRTVNVSNSTQLNAALSSVQPGDHIVLANGNYSGSFRLARTGTSDAPIVVKAASKNGTVISGGTFTLASPFTGVYGLGFSTGNTLSLQILASDTFALRNWFAGARCINLSTQQRVRIGYNRFTGGPVRGLAEGHQIHVEIPERSSLPEGGRIYRNAMISPSGTGASEEFMHVYIGDSGGFGDVRTPSLQDFRVEYNLISDTVRRRGVYTKRGGQIQFNHIIGKGPGVNGIRHGGRGTLAGNTCVNVDSVIVNGPDHRILGNYIRARKGLRLECERRTSGGTRYNAAHRALLSGNDATVTVGYFESGDTLVAPVDGVQIYNHTGSVIMGRQTNTNWVQQPRPDVAYPQPVALSATQVGPDAP
jgi:hypothetical protein